MRRKHARRYREKHTVKLNERAKAYQKKIREGNPSRFLWSTAKRRAREQGLAFDIEPSDIVIPTRCPLLGVPLRRGQGVVLAESPTLDRRDPTLGYVKGNVWVISHRANSIKQDASLAELALLVQNLERELTGKKP